MYPKWQSSIRRFSQIWLQAKNESKIFKTSFCSFGHWFEPCIEIGDFFPEILATGNLKRHLILALKFLFPFLAIDNQKRLLHITNVSLPLLPLNTCDDLIIDARALTMWVLLWGTYLGYQSEVWFLLWTHLFSPSNMISLNYSQSFYTICSFTNCKGSKLNYANWSVCDFHFSSVRW